MRVLTTRSKAPWAVVAADETSAEIIAWPHTERAAYARAGREARHYPDKLRLPLRITGGKVEVPEIVRLTLAPCGHRTRPMQADVAETARRNPDLWCYRCETRREVATDAGVA